MERSDEIEIEEMGLEPINEEDLKDNIRELLMT
jgi:hypothetical protein